MAGLIKENFNEEVLTEISWIMTAIDDISERLKIETYEIMLIRYRIQPEEERAIDKFIALNIKDLDSLTIDEIQDIIAGYFFEMTQKTWSVENHVVEKLINLRKAELGL